MELKLNKPIVFFDLESTGVNVGKDKIIEISMIKVMPDGKEEEKTLRINPNMHIPEESTRVNGITDADVAFCPTFDKVANDIKNFIGDSDLAGYNSNKFDVPMLVEEFLRAKVDFKIEGRRLVDVQNIFHRMEPRTLIGAYKFYCKKNLKDAHTANADTRATLEVLKAQLDCYNGAEYEDMDGNKSTPIVNDVKKLSEFTKINNWADLVGHIYYNDKCVECFNFGKHKGEAVEDVFEKEPSYYAWMMNADFPLSTKRVIEKIRLRKLNTNKL
jgi:DNA polymerase-3 subunit epsilon